MDRTAETQECRVLTRCPICDNIFYGNSKLICWELAAIAQSVVRRIGSAEVTGPIPVSSSRILILKAFQGFKVNIFLCKNRTHERNIMTLLVTEKGYHFNCSYLKKVTI